MVIKVRHQPRKEVIIHEIFTCRDPKELVRVLTTGMPADELVTPLKWINGILFGFDSLITSDTFAKEIIQGRLHWGYVILAPMPKYQSSIALKGRPRVDIIDVSVSETFQAIGLFLKNKILPKHKNNHR